MSDDHAFSDLQDLSSSTSARGEDEPQSQNPIFDYARALVFQQQPPPSTHNHLHTDSHSDSDSSNNNPDTHDISQLIQTQSTKLSLSQKRDELITQRSQLSNEIDELRSKLRTLRQQQIYKTRQAQLKTLLDQNNQENITSLGIIKQRGDNDDKVWKKFNVSPSLDWNQRLEYVKMFIPYLELEQLYTMNYYDREDRLIRSIEFVVVSPLLFKIGIRILIKCEDNSLMKIEIKEGELVGVALVAPDFHRVLMRNYIPGRKIDCIMFGFNSVSNLLQRRISIMYKLIRMFRRFIQDERFEELLRDEEMSDQIRLFSILKSIERLELVIQGYKFILVWKVIFQDIITAISESQIRLFVTDMNNNQCDQLNYINEMFNNLIVQYGVINSLQTILKNVFPTTVI
ncbi:uncharacterized protein J8A68_001075 [[Candida] subhashii]|uniref:Uncharacterized protein n=1 Tax=[Candida] subhashii TaxID=561895 RepID=A0A8J5USR8_9ASCO|nr:uncharacterized protein J8A68_001075 [[Candida] subhashii]KAG7665387.1 hypothetical protein J8A68_001075 [[Candida] subhashii]